MRERDIFIEAIQKESSTQRAQYLDTVCGADADLRSRVDRLLLEHHRQETFMLDGEAPGVQGATADLASHLVTAGPGAIIGRYKLLEPIGEGGYGTVFMAEQTTPVQRKVALKVIKAGMDTRQVIARFEAERQALALMDHPNIAKVFDAGVTDAGRPYFVMELVKGVPMTKYCDEHRLPLHQRLELFVQVCLGVQHAHQKGIIHRDLKPTNVLVALYDSVAVPKVIDFGVAKATGQRLTDRTMFTGFGDVIGTPQYMSPEQAELNQLDVDTRSDIYSLGVLLYELLTGSTPLEQKRAKEGALLEVLRLIREEEPPKPSTRLTTLDKLPAVAAQRGLDPRKLASLIKGELDWIVMKALEKDRNRRYETANGFAMDVQRYLADEPVHACPPSATYRFRKFARRNKATLLTVIVVMAALVGGTTVSTWQAIRATRATHAEQAALKIAKANEQAAKDNAERADAEKTRAEDSAKRADAERQRAEDTSYKARRAVSAVVVHAAMGAMGGGKWSGMPIEYRKLLAAEALKYYDSLIQTNSAEPAVRYETAMALGNVGLMHWSFEEYDKGEKFYRRSADVLDALVRDVPRPAEYRHHCAYAHLQTGRLLMWYLHRADDAEKELRIAMALYEGLLSESPARLNLSTELADCYNQLIGLIAPAPEAQTLYRKLVVCAEAACQPFMAQNLLTTRPADQARREASALGDIASSLAYAPASVGRDHELAIRISRAAIKLEPTCGWQELGAGHYLAGDYRAAEEAFGKAIDLKSNNWSVGELMYFAMTLWRQGNKPRALLNYEAGAKARGNGRVGWLQREAAELLGVTIPPSTQPSQGPAPLNDPPRLRQAEAAISVTTAPTLPAPARWTVKDLDANNVEAWKLRRDGKVEESAALRERVVAEAKRLLPPDDIRLAKYLLGYGDVLTLLQRFDEAEVQYGHASTILEHQSAPASQEMASLEANLSRLQKARGGAATTLPTTATTTPTTSRAAPTPARELLAWDRQSPQGVARAVEAALIADLASPSLSPFDRLVYGEHLILGGEPSRAVAAIRQALDEAKRTGAVQPFYYKSLGWALLAAGESEQAAAALSQVSGDESRWKAVSPPADADPDAWTAAYFLSRVTQEQYTSHFSQPANASFPWFYVGQLMEIHGKRDAAVLAYQKAIGLGTHHTRHWAAYRLQSLAQQPDSPAIRSASPAK